ncbi:hypothetical protein NMY22_g13789 [Coprinellus aureogranulatus]|nr:hypothetical protein NMY22_g13789 [Coprinellus aureogranulatus]
MLSALLKTNLPWNQRLWATRLLIPDHHHRGFRGRAGGSIGETPKTRELVDSVSAPTEVFPYSSRPSEVTKMSHWLEGPGVFLDGSMEAGGGAITALCYLWRTRRPIFADPLLLVP